MIDALQEGGNAEGPVHAADAVGGRIGADARGSDPERPPAGAAHHRPSHLDAGGVRLGHADDGDALSQGGVQVGAQPWERSFTPVPTARFL